jgi:uncharacterized membrane protein YvbJ
MKSKTFKTIGILALIAAIFYWFSRKEESKEELENKLQAAIKREDYESAKKIREKLKRI